MEALDELKYTKSHEWVKINGTIATCGITYYAQSELSDIVYLELHPVGTEVEKGKSFGTIEAVKAVSDMYAPISGKIIEINKNVIDAPNLVNEDPYGKGWMIKIEMNTPEEINEFLTSEEYLKSIVDEHK
ncbi:MAG: glycine cleavage system protein GcvH [Candidatus Stahlbacteria bacterium]|nr:glycine cleavage system protein GcvH [Candidatus Stahlbacteria bacterium]